MLDKLIFKKKAVGFTKNIKKHGLIFHYNIISYLLLVIGYDAVRRIICSCSECLRKLSSPWNRIKDKYNQDQYKGENQNFVYWLACYRILQKLSKYSLY